VGNTLGPEMADRLSAEQSTIKMACCKRNDEALVELFPVVELEGLELAIVFP